MTDPHTCPTCGVDLFLVGVLLTEGYFLKFTREMVGCTAVKVPVRVDAVGTISSGSNLFLIFGRSLIFFKTVKAVFSRVPEFTIDLATHGIRASLAVPAAATPSVVGGGAPATGVGAIVVAATATARPALGARRTTVARGVAATATGRDVGRRFEAACPLV